MSRWVGDLHGVLAGDLGRKKTRGFTPQTAGAKQNGAKGQDLHVLAGDLDRNPHVPGVCHRPTYQSHLKNSSIYLTLRLPIRLFGRCVHQCVHLFDFASIFSTCQLKTLSLSLSVSDLRGVLARDLDRNPHVVQEVAPASPPL